MTSSSGTEAHLALTLALLALAGCAQQPIEETQALVVAESEACQMAAMGMEQVNRYQAYLFAFTGADPDSAQPPCVECIVNGRCPLVERACGCTEPHPPLTGAINRQIAGLAFRDIEPDRPYCVALLAMDDPTSMLGPGEPREACECLGASGAPVTSCGLSPFPGFVEENASAVFVSMDCTTLQCAAVSGTLGRIEMASGL